MNMPRTITLPALALAATLTAIALADDPATAPADPAPAPATQPTTAPATQPATQPATRPASSNATTTVVAPASPQVIAWLEKLEARGDQLTSYQATVVYTREQELLGDKQVRIGAVSYRAGKELEAISPRFAIHFTHLIENNRRTPAERRYVFDGQWLVEVHPDRKQFFKRQLVPPGRQYNPLKIGEGPFPLPLGQKTTEVLKRFTVQIVEDAEDKPLHLRLRPRINPDTGEPASKFTTIDLWYDRTTLLPTKVATADDTDNTTTVDLRNPVTDGLDEEQAAKVFDTTTPALGSGWRVEIKPWRDRPAPPPSTE